MLGELGQHGQNQSGKIGHHAARDAARNVLLFIVGFVMASSGDRPSRGAGRRAVSDTSHEARLRRLYVADEIALEEFERRLANAAMREEARGRSAARASAPMTPEERRAAAERVAMRPAAPRNEERCPTCRSVVRHVHEYGQDATWCPGCSRYLGTDPRVRGHARDGRPAAGGVVFGAVYVESGPDLDGDGDVDGGLFDGFLG